MQPANVPEPALQESRSAGRNRRRMKRRKRGIQGWLRGRQAGRSLSALMAVAAFAYVTAATADAWLTATRFGQAKMNMTQAAFRTQFGPPTSVAANGDWFYRDRGKTFAASFDPDRKLASFRCSEVPDSLELCPMTMGLRIGTLERELLLKLGAPTDVTTANGTRVMHYAGLGLSFRMRDQEVREITLSRSDDRLAFLRQIGWLLVP